MGRKPFLSLAGMFLAGVTLTGCESTDWCCGKNKSKDQVARPTPNWNTQPQYQAPATTGLNRTGTPSDQSVAKPDTSTLPGRDSTSMAPRTGLQGSSTTTVGSQDIAPPPPPAVDRQFPATRPMDDSNLTPASAVPRSSAPGINFTPAVDSPPTQPPEVLPPLNPSKPPVPELPSNPDLPDLVAPPPPVPASPGQPAKTGSSQSSSKYQNPPSALDIEPPPPPRGVPAMPGAGPTGN